MVYRWRLLHMPIVLTLSLLLLGIGGWQASATEPLSWTNPLVLQRADPHVTYHDGTYLLIATVPEYDRIELRRAATLDGLRDAAPRVIWRRHAQGPMSWHIWAPELHHLDGRWYVYFAASRAERHLGDPDVRARERRGRPARGHVGRARQLKTQLGIVLARRDRLRAPRHALPRLGAEGSRHRGQHEPLHRAGWTRRWSIAGRAGGSRGRSTAVGARSGTG
jgi:hypothetical protein